jgi:hypothetical protein
MLLTDEQRDHQVALWRASGQSRAAFCREHSLPYNSFLAWAKRAAMVASASGDESAFIQVRRFSPGVAQRAEPLVAIVSLTCGLTLQVAPGTDADWIGRVIAAVRSC